jgi:hypothetical protein
MIRSLWLPLLSIPLYAHTVSMSTGELTVNGSEAQYRLRMPIYETQHVRAPERELLAAISFANARLTRSTCRADNAMYVCDAVYSFLSEPDIVDVTCRFSQITVPNHVHMLHARRGEHIDQAVFDDRIQQATLRFRPVGVIENVLRTRPAAAGALLLVSVALALLSRAWREFGLLAACFITAGAVALLIAWPLTPAFIEAAIALAAGYAAVEALLLPDAGQRWIAAVALGLAFGSYGATLLLRFDGGFSAGLFALALAAMLCLATFKLGRSVKIAQAAVLVIAMFWFGSIVL